MGAKLEFFSKDTPPEVNPRNSLKVTFIKHSDEPLCLDLQ